MIISFLISSVRQCPGCHPSCRRPPTRTRPPRPRPRNPRAQLTTDTRFRWAELLSLPGTRRTRGRPRPLFSVFYLLSSNAAVSRIRYALLALPTLLAPLVTSGCHYVNRILPGKEFGTVVERPPAPPVPRRPTDRLGASTYEAARTATRRRIIISLQDKWLWLVEGKDTLFAAPAAVGMDETFTFRDKTYHFKTPRGRLTVLDKAADPRWVPPDWHYYEIAADKKLEPVFLRRGQKIKLSDDTYIEVRADGVGRINRFGNFWPFTPGTEIIFDGKIFIPPFGTPQREVPEVLGTHKIDLGDGYLIHGTNAEDSIGRPVTHGCIRLYNEDVARLFNDIYKGVPVYIF